MSDSPSADAWFGTLVERARAVDGQPPFSDQSLVDLRTGARELVAIDEVAAALMRPSTTSGTVEAEFVVDPDARGRGLGTQLLETLLSRSPTELLVWAHGDHPAARALAASHGLTAVRELLHLSRELPAFVGLSTSNPTKVGNSGITTFTVGHDEDAWVALNAIIFASHPEQGSVSRADLEQLESEPWFSADDFLVLRDGDAMIGYCWLKIEGNRGEFYVVGVHPDRQGDGLGSRLFDAGLDRMRELGIRIAHLYVEGDNAPALELYRSRGFERDGVDVQYAVRHQS
ncbi:MAG TPA: mycothiol synthase [Galbitalea sp.]